MITNLSINTENLTKTQRYSHELHVTNGPFPPPQRKLSSHQKQNKRKQSTNCPQFNTQRRVRGQNHAIAHLFGVSGREWKQDGGKQWLNVFVTESQKLIAAYLHSQDRSSPLNGGSCGVNKVHCFKIKKAGDTVARPLCVKGLLLAPALSPDPKSDLFSPPRGQF